MASYGPGERLTSSNRYIKIDTATGVDLKGAPTYPDHFPRALWVGTAGTATLVDGAGQTATNFPLLQGENPISITQLTSLGTASDVWALY